MFCDSSNLGSIEKLRTTREVLVVMFLRYTNHSNYRKQQQRRLFTMTCSSRDGAEDRYIIQKSLQLNCGHVIELFCYLKKTNFNGLEFGYL